MHSQEFPEDPVLSRKVLEWVTVANDFCLFMERCGDYTKADILGYLQKVLPLIYLKASLLPQVNVENEDATEHFVTEEQWENLFTLLRSRFGEDDLYFFRDHHEKMNSDPVKASLSENLADIYQDIKDFLLLYQKPLKAARENAIRDCRNLFETRFGYRLVNSHARIHYLLFTEGEKGELEEAIDSL
jgi:hypothetical protein